MFSYQLTAQQKSIAKTTRVPADTLKSGSVFRDTDNDILQPKKATGIEKTNAFFDSLQNKTSEKAIMRELHKLLVSRPEYKKVNGSNEISVSPFLAYNEKIIRNITIRQLNVFGPSVFNDNTPDQSRLSKFGNLIHINTNKKILEKRLLFKPGEPIDPNLLADNERLIRTLPYIKDVRFLVNETGETDSVDIVVIVQDVLPTAFDIEIWSSNQGNFTLWNNNMVGLGHELKNRIFWDSEESPLLGYAGRYKIFSIGNSYISANMEYVNKFQEVSYLVDVSRNFFTPDIKYAGGVKYFNTSSIRNFTLPDTIYRNLPLDYTMYDFWIGRSFPLKPKEFSFRSRTNLIVSARIIHYNFSKRPEVQQNLFHKYHNRTIVLAGFGLSDQGFFKSNLIYSFGQTEDIPIGTLLKINIGHELGEFINRPYLGASISNGDFIFGQGYLFNKLESGGFINGDTFEQAVVAYTMKYFSPLIVNNRYKFRLFAKFNYKIGLHTFNDEFLNINDLEGINGLTIKNLYGNQKFTANVEAVCFCPYNFYGFKFAFFTSLDLASIRDDKQFIFTEWPYSGIGIGVRVRNEHLVFNTLQLKLTFFPNAPNEAKKQFFKASGESKLNPDNFYYHAPEVIEF
ncbi:MAG: hypothetical protein JXJ22_16935 [Bacteroidales bacterium]|nr:hypothetical protein [Bacteroidales bacterium]